VGQIQKEGGVRVTFNIVHGLLCIAAGQIALIYGVVNHFLIFIKEKIRHIITEGDTVKLVETLAPWHISIEMAKMPLTDHSCGVARLL